MIKIITSNGTENSFGTSLPDIKETNEDRTHSRSNNAKGSDSKTFDSESLMNLEWLSQPISSEAGTLSCIINNYCPEMEMEYAMACPLVDRDNISHLWLYMSDNDELRRLKNYCVIEIIAPGTKLMEAILFPTVIIKIEGKKLSHSMLYYVVLQPPPEQQYFEEIVCLMFSSPANHKTAELLPLHVKRSEICTGEVSLVPMLLDKGYKSMFEKGCTFRVKSIEQGRCSDQNIRKWKNYDVEKSKIPQLLTRLLYLDIAQIPIHIYNPLKMSLDIDDRKQNFVPVKEMSHLSYMMIDDLQIGNPSNFLHDTMAARRTRKRHSSFGKFLNAATRTRTDKDFVGHLKPRPTSELKTYVSLSGMV